ncbi:MAG: hypothetical protein QW521_03420 [Desulfurococcaceae archaeon]
MAEGVKPSVKEVILKSLYATKKDIPFLLELLNGLNERLREYSEVEHLKEQVPDEYKFVLRRYNEVVLRVLDTLFKRLSDYSSFTAYLVESEEVTVEDVKKVFEEDEESKE